MRERNKIPEEAKNYKASADELAGGEYIPNKDDIWQANLAMSAEQYKLSRRRELKHFEKSEKYSRIKELFFDLNRRLRHLVKGEKLEKFDIEDDPKFFDFLINVARDYKNALNHLADENPNMKKMCLRVTTPLSSLINHELKKNYPTKGAEAVAVAGGFNTEGFRHWWVQVGSTIVDVTPEQYANHEKLDAETKQVVSDNITEEGVFVSNDSDNPLYQKYLPSSVLRLNIGDDLAGVGLYIEDYDRFHRDLKEDEEESIRAA